MLNNTNALVQFCEKKYIYSNYITEFYNTFSNIFYIIFGLYWLYFLNKNNISELNYFCYSVIFVGISSGLFHSTSNYYMELIDEFSMFLLNMLILDKFNNINSKKNLLVFLNNITIFSLNISFIYYIINKSFTFFVNSFGISIAIILLNLYFHNINNIDNIDNKNIKFKIIGSLSIGKIFWLAEQNLCNIFYSIFICHSLWHFFTALTCYYTLNYIYIIESQKKLKY